MRKSSTILRNFPKIVSVVLIGAGLLLHPQYAAQGVKEGLSLLGAVVIPSLFPFLVLSSYLCESSSVNGLCRIFEKPAEKIFKINGNCILPVFLGSVGGYPVGAKSVAELYENKKITKNEAERLFYWCVNSGPAFTVSAVGTMMLGNIKSGFLIYFSSLLSSLTIGFFCRFLYIGQPIKTDNSFVTEQKKYPLITAVSNGASAMLNISSWILCFSCLSALIDTIKTDNSAKIFIKSVLEVTTGCRECAGKVPIPVIAAMLGFGGLSVICQVSPYLNSCGVQLKRFFSARILNAALCAFYSSQLLKIFPQAGTVSTTFHTSVADVHLSFTTPVFAILTIMCGLLIFELDNRKKVC